MTTSPLPLWQVLPVRARPKPARLEVRSNWRPSSGASVAITITIEPSSLSSPMLVRPVLVGRALGGRIYRQGAVVDPQIPNAWHM